MLVKGLSEGKCVDSFLHGLEGQGPIIACSNGWLGRLGNQAHLLNHPRLLTESQLVSFTPFYQYRYTWH